MLTVVTISHLTRGRAFLGVGNWDWLIKLGETSKFITESHKMLQGDVCELFL